MKTPTIFFCFCFSLILSFSVLGQTLTSAEAKERIARAMPSPLPQSPVVKRATSDRADDGLKGRVKSVVTSLEDSEEVGASRIQSEVTYDKAGNLVSRVLYDYQGNPWQLTTYGFIDGKRLNKIGYISYDYDPPRAAAPLGSKDSPKPPIDNRYDLSYEYSYDKRKRLVERRTFANTGLITSKTVYKYGGTTVEKTSFDSKGQINSVSIETYDKKKNLVEARYPARNQYGESINKYEYTQFDSRGNWTRRKTLGKMGKYGGGQSDFVRIEVRVITYF